MLILKLNAAFPSDQIERMHKSVLIQMKDGLIILPSYISVEYCNENYSDVKDVKFITAEEYKRYMEEYNNESKEN